MPVHGMEDLMRKLEQMQINIPLAMEASLVSGAQIVKNSAQDIVAYKTGTLRRSIHVEPAERTATRVVVAVGTDEPYARRIEYGFNGPDRLGRVFHQPARPYLRPAVDKNRATVKAEVIGALKAIVQEAAR